MKTGSEWLRNLHDFHIQWRLEQGSEWGLANCRARFVIATPCSLWLWPVTVTLTSLQAHLHTDSALSTIQVRGYCHRGIHHKHRQAPLSYSYCMTSPSQLGAKQLKIFSLGGRGNNCCCFNVYLSIWLHLVLVAACGLLSCGMRTQLWHVGSSSLTGTEPGALTLEVQNPSHWTTKDVPAYFILNYSCGTSNIPAI